MKTIGRIAKLTAATWLFSAILTAGYAMAATIPISVTIPKAGTMTLTQPVALNGTVGMTRTTTVDITGIKTNTPWNITVYKESDLTDGMNTIPSNQLMFTSTFQIDPVEFPTSDDPVMVAAGAKTGEAGHVETIIYRLRLTYDDAPGTYTANHIYTLNAP